MKVTLSSANDENIFGIQFQHMSEIENFMSRVGIRCPSIANCMIITKNMTDAKLIFSFWLL